MLHTGTFSVPRTADEVFDLLAQPERFAPLMPDFESVTIQDASHFTLRVAIQLGPIRGHANLAMELAYAQRASSVGYRGSAMVAGSRLQLNLEFRLTPAGDVTDVGWRGELALSGGLAFLGGDLLQARASQNFGRMAQSLQASLRQAPSTAGETDGPQSPAGSSDYEI